MAFRIIVVLFLALFSQLAHAGDYAFERIIGFSPDGRYFGFEEYGVQDGSGFPYSNIYIIDLKTDSFVPSSPVRVRLDDENNSLNSARKIAREQAKPLIKNYKLNSPAQTAYARGIGDFANFEQGPNAEIISKVFLPSFTDPTGPARKSIDLILNQFSLPNTPNCPEETQGFKLEKLDEGGRHLIHKDTKIFKSRGCAIEYRISGVYTPAFVRGDYAAVMISVFQFGFEGRDGRFIVYPMNIK